MERRDFLVGAVAAGAGTALAAPAVAQERIDIALVTTWPRDFRGSEQAPSASPNG